MWEDAEGVEHTMWQGEGGIGSPIIRPGASGEWQSRGLCWKGSLLRVICSQCGSSCSIVPARANYFLWDVEPQAVAEQLVVPHFAHEPGGKEQTPEVQRICPCPWRIRGAQRVTSVCACVLGQLGGLLAHDPGQTS